MVKIGVNVLTTYIGNTMSYILWLAYHVNQRVILYVKPKLGIEPGIFSLNFVVISFLSKSKTGDLLNHFKICHWSIDPIWPAWLQLVENKATLKLKFVPNHLGHVFGFWVFLIILTSCAKALCHGASRWWGRKWKPLFIHVTRPHIFFPSRKKMRKNTSFPDDV